MREIKFRVRKETEDGVEIRILSFSDLYLGIFNIEWIKAGRILSKDQFTGLKDKNGKEIYEGDIVDIHPVNPHRHNSKKRNVIQWINGGLFLKSIDGSILGYGELPSGHRIEVVSNIYENPNLLEVKG